MSARSSTPSVRSYGHIDELSHQTERSAGQPMVPHHDIWSAAVMMVKRYDDDAILEAIERGKVLLKSGDVA